MGECNTILGAYTMYRHLEWCCTHPSICCTYIDMFNPLLDYKILAWSKLKQIAVDILKRI